MIKNLSTLLLLVLIPTMLLAQSRPEFVQKTKVLTGEEVITKAVNPDKYSVVDDLMWVDGTVVGFTYYDYMTNGALGQHILSFDDNTLMVGTMAAQDNQASTSQRGTYYNYNNGTAWLDTAVIWDRIEAQRSGWGNIAAFPSVKSAVVVSHVGSYLNINGGTPDAPAWIQSTVPQSATAQWPKHAAVEVGSNANIYVTGGNGLPSPFFRSTDGGTSWDIINKALADTNSDLYADYRTIGADDYMIDAMDSKVAVLSAVTGGDVFVFTSDDQGVNFTSTQIYDVAKIDTNLAQFAFDTSFFPGVDYKMLGVGYPDGSCDLLIDPNGVVHVAFGMRELGYYINTDTLGNAVRDAEGRLQRTFFITDYNPSTGIFYWNSSMTGMAVQAVLPSADMVGPSLIFKFRGSAGFYPTCYQGGLDMAMTGMPQLSYDDNGNVYMAFQGFKEGDRMLLDPEDETTWSPFGHVYLTASANGTTWTTPVDMYPGTTGEDVLFPALTNRANGGMLHVLVQNDQVAGTWLQQTPLHPQTKNAFLYKAVTPPAVGVNDEPGVVNNFELQQNYPNPFNPATIINYSLPSRSNVSLKVYDVLGREVRSLVNASQEAGSYTVSFDGTGLASGLYVYTLEAGSFKVSKKMMLMK